MTLNATKQPNPPLSGTQRLVGMGLFTALALALNGLHFPAPYAPFLFYEIWEIPIVVALLIFGLRAAIVISIIDFVALLLIFPGSLATGPLYNLVAVLSMLLGVVLGHRFMLRPTKTFLSMVTVPTILAVVLRVATMTAFNATFLPFPPPLGFGFPVQFISPTIGFIAVFNASLAAYTIPIAYWVVRALPKRYRIPLAYPPTTSTVASATS